MENEPNESVASKVIQLRPGAIGPETEGVAISPEGIAYAERLIKRTLTLGKTATAMTERTEALIDDEVEFQRWYGFALGRRGRAAVCKLVEELDLTRQEVSDLWRSGCLHWDGRSLELEQPLRATVSSWILILMFGSLAAMMVVVLFTAAGSAPLARGVLLALFAFFFCGALYVRKRLILPFSQARRRQKAEGGNG